MQHKYDSPAKFKAFVVSLLRRGSISWPPRSEAYKAACAGKQVNKSTGRMAMHYKCAGCGGLFPMKECKADHISPVVGPEGFEGWDTYITRMFCPVSNFQILCGPCHDVKTAAERQERKK